MTNHTQNNDQVEHDDELDPQLHQLLDDLDNPMDESSHDEATKQLLQRLDSLKPQTLNSGEVLDGVPDQVQESIRLDRRAQQRLDHQHDEIDYDESATSTTDKDSAFSDTRHDPTFLSLGESKERLTPLPTLLTERPVGELSDGVEDTMQESDEHSNQGIIYEYQISAVLPTVVQQTIQMALDHIHFGESIDRYPLLASFRVDTEDVLVANLREWANKYLPINTGFERVYSTVVGQNTYIAGWQLTNSQAIQRAQTALTIQLASLITTIPSPEAIYSAILPLMPSIPVDLFPTVVTFLQRHFHATSWDIEAIVLHRRQSESNGPWEVILHTP
ncbi:MAG: hypothetical protein H6673_03080 [Anaerolineales bacterium]|nr:hypothetical protein [Anaerolineales bacterium]